MKKKLVTIMTPCYNGEKYIANLLNSIINQTYPYIEFICVNDGSTDNTEKVIEKYSDILKNKNIELKYVKQKNGGIAKAINRGLKLVEGEFLIWPDSDDYFEQDSIEIMVKFLKENPKYNAVRGKVVFRKDNDTKDVIEIRKSKNPEKTNLFLNYINEEDIYCFCGVIMIKTNYFFKVNKGRDIYVNKAGQNWQMILPAVYKSKTGYINKVVYNYLVRENSHSHKKQGELAFLLKQRNFRKILNKTINKIVEDKEEKKQYLNIIKEKYDKIEKEFFKYKFRNFSKEHIKYKLRFFSKENLKYRFRHFSKEHIKYKLRNWNINYIKQKIKQIYKNQ